MEFISSTRIVLSGKHLEKQKQLVFSKGYING